MKPDVAVAYWRARLGDASCPSLVPTSTLALDAPMHCWHYVTGHTDGLGTSGIDTCYCCHCGMDRERRWTIQSQQVEGHGPHYRETQKVYEDGE